MRVQLSILLFVGLFVGLLATMKVPHHCGHNYNPSPLTVKCEGAHSNATVPVPRFCGWFQRCEDGCPGRIYKCPNCKPFDWQTKLCLRQGPNCYGCDE